MFQICKECNPSTRKKLGHNSCLCGKLSHYKHYNKPKSSRSCRASFKNLGQNLGQKFGTKTRTKFGTDGQTDRRTDGQTDRQDQT